MVTINRAHKHSCENTRVLLPLTGIHGVHSQVQPMPVVHWDKRAMPQCTPTP